MALFRFSSTSPMDRLVALQRELDRVFESPPQRFGLGGPMRGAFPAVNVFDDRDSYLVRLEAPGVEPDQFGVEANGRTLTISGNRASKAVEGMSFHRRERECGSFSRSLQLPEDVDTSGAEASYKHGVLTVRVPKRAEARPRQITVRAA